MSHIYRILLTLLSIASICKALPDVHKYMTPHQLQSVFHVDNAADVPHYEVVQLFHHTTDPGVSSPSIGHYRNRRSIASASPSGVPLKEPHHVKKDLSKNPYYSKLKAAAASAGGDSTNSVYGTPEKPLRTNINDLSKLSEHNVSFSAFGENHNLTLRATQGLFKGAPHELRMWTVNSEANATHGLDLQEVLDGHQNSDDIGHVFQDEDNMAAILMRRHTETGDLIMEGSIGHEMVIKPLPHNLSPSQDQAHHVIFKREAPQMEHLSDFAFMEPDDLAASEKLEKLQQLRRRRRSTNLADLAADDTELGEDELEDEDELTTAESRKRSRRQTPYMIYPEILVIVDYDGYRLHGGDNLQVKRYFISFWNGVDLRYRLLKGPKIRISIAGIIISRGRDATPYLERNRVGRDAIDSAAALTDMGKYLFRERRLPVYDIAVAITKYDMCRRRKGGRCTKGTAGFAYVGGACVVNKRLEKVNSVAIIEDTGGFSGIIVAAHEVGHLLGAVHDGSPPPSYLGGPGAQRCRWEDGYIMSDLRHTERGFRWSPCTVQSFHHFLNGDTATCLHNQPHEDGALGRSLPGTLLSLDAQCRRDRGTYACFKDERVCAQLFCFDAQTGYCVAYRPAAEGSSCGNGLNCLDGRCTPSPTNNIGYGPQYSLVYNNADATKSVENTENSSEEEDGDDEDDDDENEAEVNENGDEGDEGNNTKSNEEDHEDENALQNLQKNDNSVEETSLELTDENENNDTKKMTITPTNSMTTIRPTILTQTQQNPLQIQTQKQTQLNAIEYLKYLLENKPQWQHLLNATTFPSSTITPTQTHIQQSTNNENPPLVKTSTSSSVSFSSSSTSTSSSKNSNDNGHNNTNSKPNEQKQSINTSNNEITDSKQHEEEYQSYQQQHNEAHNKKHQKLTPQHLFKNISTNFQKQFQYYLNLFNRNIGTSTNKNSSILNSSNENSSSSSRSSSSSNNHFGILKTPKTTKYATTESTVNKKTTNSPNSNYSATNNKNNGHSNPHDDDENLDDENEEDNSNDNVESNEAIDKQKRKFDVKFTTRFQQQNQQLQNGVEKPISTTIASVQPTGRNAIFGGRSPTTARSKSLLDAYFRKLQALNSPALSPTTAQSPSITTVQATPPNIKLLSTTTTSSTSSSSSSSKTTTTASSVSKNNKNQQQQYQKEFDKFAGHFLKRTPSSYSKNNRNSSYSHISNSNSHHHEQNHDNNSNLNKNNNTNNIIKNHQLEKQQKIKIKNISPPTTQQPAYVTNYIGDQTNNLPAIVVSDDRKQSHSLKSPINISSLALAAQQHQQQQHNQEHQQKQQKIKIQKLIRRQLRTQIK